MASDKMVVAAQNMGVVPGSVLQAVAAEAEVLFKGQMFPQHKSAQAIATICLKAHELGIGPVWALQKFYIDKQGRMGTFSDNMLALALQRGITFEVTQCDDKACEMVFERWDNPHRSPMTFTSRFTIEDARRAGLTNKDTYKYYPADLLKWKAVARGLMTLCPDFVAGLAELTCMGAEIIPGPDGQPMPLLDSETGLLEIDADFSQDSAANTDTAEPELPTVTDADLEEFKSWGKELCTERGIKGKQLSEAVDRFLIERQKMLNQLTPQELTLLMQDIQAHDFGGE
jgi:hypothetical protein